MHEYSDEEDIIELLGDDEEPPQPTSGKKTDLEVAMEFAVSILS